MSSYIGSFNGQNITGTDKVLVDTSGGKFDSLSLACASAEDAATVSLYYASKLGNDITSTTVLAAESEAVSCSSVTLTVDTVAATADAFVNEKVYKSDGTLFGTCTAIGGATSITFGDGLSQKLTHADSLYMGIDHFFLNDVVIPYGVSLKLEEDEFSFPSNEYKMWITCTTCSTTNTLDITIR